MSDIINNNIISILFFIDNINKNYESNDLNAVTYSNDNEMLYDLEKLNYDVNRDIPQHPSSNVILNDNSTSSLIDFDDVNVIESIDYKKLDGARSSKIDELLVSELERQSKSREGHEVRSPQEVLRRASDEVATTADVIKQHSHSNDNLSSISNSIFNSYYNNNLLNMNKDDIDYIKKLYNLDINNISDLLSYLFINNVFEYPWYYNLYDIDIIKENTHSLINNNDFNIDKELQSNFNNIYKSLKLHNNINISYDAEKLYQPLDKTNILGFFNINKNDYIYNDIIYYISEELLIKYQPINNSNYTLNELSKTINKLIDSNNNISSKEIKNEISTIKQNNINFNMLLPFYIINYFNKELIRNNDSKAIKIINVNNDVGQWLFASLYYNIEEFISINQYKMDNINILNIYNLCKNVYKKELLDIKNIKYVNNDYLYNDYNIDLIYYNCELIHEHDNNNYKHIIYNEYFSTINLLWDQLKNKGYIIFYMFDKKNIMFTELINSYIDFNYKNSEYIGLFYINYDIEDDIESQSNETSIKSYPIWVWKKNNNINIDKPNYKNERYDISQLIFNKLILKLNN